MIVVKPPKDFENLPEQVVDLPPSKYIANRLVIIAALAKGKSTLQNLPDNNDIRVALEGVKALGADYKIIKKNNYTFDVEINGFDGEPNPSGDNPTVYGGDNGTFSRLIAPVLLLSKKSVVLDASEQMKKRPMADLFDVMKKAGAKITCLEKEGFLPARIEGEYEGGELKLPGNISSQYFSALLISAPYAKKDVSIIPTTPLVSLNYVVMTAQMISGHGANITATCEWDFSEILLQDKLLGKNHHFCVEGSRKKTYRSPSGSIPSDVTAATYFIAMGSLGLHLRLLTFQIHSIQGETNFFEVLQRYDLLKVDLRQNFRTSDGMKSSSLFGEYRSSTPLSNNNSEKFFSLLKEMKESPLIDDMKLLITFDLSVSKSETLIEKKNFALFVDIKNMPDAGPTFLVLAVAYAHSYSIDTDIFNIDHLRHKESNRVEGMCAELEKIGADIKIGVNAIVVRAKKLDKADFKKAVLNSLGDHRLAMSFSLLSFIFPDVGICIDGEKSVDKTFPHYFEMLEKLGFSVEKK